MSKRQFIIVGEVLAFFAGAILISEFPIIGTLIVFLSVIIGFVGGYFFNKMSNDETIGYLRDQLNETRIDLNSALKENGLKDTEIKGLQNDYYKILEENKAFKEEVKSLKQATDSIIEEKKESSAKKSTKKKTK